MLDNLKDQLGSLIGEGNADMISSAADKMKSLKPDTSKLKGLTEKFKGASLDKLKSKLNLGL